MGEVFGFLVLLALGGLFWLFQGKEERSNLYDNNGGEWLLLEDLTAISFPLSGPCQATLIRQSGNVYRELGVFPTVEAAIEEAAKSFRRAKVSAVRVTHSDSQSLAIYRDVYDFRGRAEGKKLAGAVLEAVTVDQGPELDHLQMALREVKSVDGDEYYAEFDFSCGHCGHTEIEAPHETDDLSEVFCNGCGVVFGTLGDLKVRMKERGAAAVRASDVKAQDQS